MKLVVLVLSLLLLGSWLLLSYVLFGQVHISWLKLALPKTTAEFGDSIGILNGLFSALAVVLALVAVLLQGKELRASTEAQNEQANALRAQLIHQEKINSEQLKRSQTMLDQLQQQQIANRAIILQAQQQYHASEVARMDALLEKLEGNHEKADLFNNSVSKKKEHLNNLKNIQKQFQEI
ncbi:hypothetical protein [Methylomonas sp. TEB]|uniref:hypothetical protein n=1 Tax=Methylomonas sp. TEB TaxID=3398229 RepID=UPI0039F4C294